MSKDKEVVCTRCYGSGFIPFPIDLTCYVCEGTGKITYAVEEDLNHIQDSFEQHGPPPPVEEPKPKFKVDFGEAKMGLDMSGFWMIDKEGNKVPMLGKISDIKISPYSKDDSKAVHKGYKGEIKLESNLSGIFEQFMDAVSQANNTRVAMRYLTVWGIDELLDLYNDYKQLFDMFGDKEYSDYMKDILKVLKAKTTK